jgi:hypothetical protein
MKWRFKPIFIILILFIGCSEKEDNPTQEKDFYPLQLGDWWLYQVDSISYNRFSGTTDTVRYQMQFTIESWLDSLDQSFAGQWLRRSDSTNPWRKMESSVITKDEFKVTELEGGLRVVSLIFPVSERVSWDGNAMNVLPFQRYRYSLVGMDSVLRRGEIAAITVDRRNDSNFVQLLRDRRTYAEDIGLIERIEINIEEQEQGKPQGHRVHYHLIGTNR